MAYQKYQINVSQRLDEVNQNIEYTKLRENYKSQTVFEIIGKGRNETTHSAFLSWLLAGKDLPIMGTECPLMGLLDILMHRIEEQHPQWYIADKCRDFRIAVRSRSVRICNIVASTEVNVLDIAKKNIVYPRKIGNKQINDLKGLIQQINSIHKKGKKDSVDLYITFDVEGIKNIKHIEIILENKINSCEGSPKNCPNATEYESLYQTERYHWACQNEQKDTLQFFVYLTACSSSNLYLSPGQSPSNLRNSKVWCKACEHYISINYQDIYDSILAPLLNSDRLSQQAEYLLSQYVKSMSIPVINSADPSDEEQIDIDGTTILATTPLEREKLLDFWQNNQDIVISALQVVEKRDCLFPHQWTRTILKDCKKQLLTPKETVQLIYDRYKADCMTHPELIIYNYILQEFNSLNSIKKLGKLMAIQADGKVNKERLSSAYKQLNQLAQDNKLYGIDSARQFVACDEDACLKEMEEVFEKFVASHPKMEIHQLIEDTFNSFTYKKITNYMPYHIIENDRVAGNDTLVDDVYQAIADEAALQQYIEDIKEITFDNGDEEINELLYRFWKRYQKLVMAALYVLSETDMISEEDRKGIQQVYDGISGHSRSYFTLKYKGAIVYQGLSMQGVVRNIAQKLIWTGKTGKPSEKLANQFFQDILSDKNFIFVKKENKQKQNGYVLLPAPSKCNNDSLKFVYYAAKWTMDANFGVLYNALSTNSSNSFEIVKETSNE